MSHRASAPSSPVPTARRTEMLDFDPELMARAVQDGTLEHVQLERGVFRGRIAHWATAGIRVDWGSYVLSVLARGELSRDRVSITLGLGGCGDWRVHGTCAANGDRIVFPEGGDMLIALPPQAQWLSVQVPRARLESAGLALGRCLGGSARRMAGVVDNGLRQVLLDLAPILAPQPESPAFGGDAIALAHDELLRSAQDTSITEVATRWGFFHLGRFSQEYRLHFAERPSQTLRKQHVDSKGSPLT